jgi:hypothetical protein
LLRRLPAALPLVEGALHIDDDERRRGLSVGHDVMFEFARALWLDAERFGMTFLPRFPTP